MQFNIDIWNADLIAGWAFNDNTPEDKISIELLCGDRSLGLVLADEPRDDLTSLLPDGRCAFNVPLEHLPKGLRSHLKLRFPDGQILENGDAPTESLPPALSGKGYSAFGSLWIDQPDWIDILRKKQIEGLSEEIAQRIFHFVRDGYVVIPQAVSADVVAELNARIEGVWESDNSGLFVETFLADRPNVQILPVNAQYRYGSTKLLDPYTKLAVARAASSAPSVVEFLTAIFEEPPRAFQQLHFTKGSQQPIHKDTAYVRIDSNPMAIAATWLALEDISEGTGELEYYAGSHHAPDYKFGGIAKWLNQAPDEHVDFLESLHRDADQYGHEKRSFLGKAGDVLIWHADLAHGGSQMTKPHLTRKSLVTHYTGISHEPFYARYINYQGNSQDGVLFSSHYSDVI